MSSDYAPNCTMEQVNLTFGLPKKAHQILAHLNDTRLYGPAAVDWVLSNQSKFATSMRFSLARWGSLTENQTAAVVRAATQDQEYAEAKLAETADTLPWPPGPGSRMELLVQVRSVKVQYYDAANVRPALKSVCVVVEPADRAGAKIWMTVPAAVREATNADTDARNVIGARFRCEVSVKRGNDDPHFAFGGRPTQVQMEEPA